MAEEVYKDFLPPPKSLRSLKKGSYNHTLEFTLTLMFCGQCPRFNLYNDTISYFQNFLHPGKARNENEF